MAAISQGRNRLRSNSHTRCPSPLAMSLPSLVLITTVDLEKSEDVISDLKTGRHFPRSRSRSLGVKFMDKVPLTPINVPTKFHLNNQNTLGEKCKNVISDHKTGCLFPRSRSFEVKFEDKVALAMSLPIGQKCIF